MLFEKTSTPSLHLIIVVSILIKIPVVNVFFSVFLSPFLRLLEWKLRAQHSRQGEQGAVKTLEG
jgi:hypothetical protein